MLDFNGFCRDGSLKQTTIMPNLFKEFQRREVFRTVGLYIGIAWIVIEGASILLPAFAMTM